MSIDSRINALAFAVQAGGTHEQILKAAQTFDAFLEPESKSEQSDSFGTEDKAPEEDQLRFSQRELNQAAISNWNAALDAVLKDWSKLWMNNTEDSARGLVEGLKR